MKAMKQQSTFAAPDGCLRLDMFTDSPLGLDSAIDARLAGGADANKIAAPPATSVKPTSVTMSRFLGRDYRLGVFDIAVSRMFKEFVER